MKLSTHLFSYLGRLELLTLREQCLVGATVIAFLVSTLQFFVLDPLMVEQDQVSAQLRSVQTSIERLDRQLSGRTLNPVETKHAILKAEIAGVETQLGEERNLIKQYASTLVSANQMPSLLQTLLKKGALVSLVNVPPVPLIEVSADAAAPEFQLYKHGIQLQLRGDFHSLRRYLLGVEQHSKKLLWQAISLETDESGMSLMELKLQTLSMDNAWLGV